MWPFVSRKRLEREIRHRMRLQKIAEELIDHVNLHGGFVGSDGSFITSGHDPVCIEHWQKFDTLGKLYYSTKIYRGELTNESYSNTLESPST